MLDPYVGVHKNYLTIIMAPMKGLCNISKRVVLMQGNVNSLHGIDLMLINALRTKRN